MKVTSSFSFSTKVWLTSLVVSPTLFILVEEGTGIFEDPAEGLGFVILAILFGGIFSIPNWFLLTLGVTLAGGLGWSEPATRLLIQLWATVLTIGLFAFMGGDFFVTEGIPVLPLCYWSTLSFGIWNYRF
jgi:hypothetical protein